MEKIYDLVIIGAGPSGVSCAFEASKLGLEYLLLEKFDKHCATLEKYYKDGKRVDKIYKKIDVELKGNIDFRDGTKESTLELFGNLLSNLNVIYKCEVDVVIKNEDIFTVRTLNNEVYGAKNVAICIGKMGQPNKPDYAFPTKVRKKINFNANECIDGENVLVIGGGNSAVEYALALADTCKITLNYRRKEFSRINEENATNLNSYVQNGNIQPRFGVDILGLKEAEGKIKVNFADGNSFIYDRLVYAIGGVAPVDFLKKCLVQVDSNGVPISADIQSGIEGLFVAGDLLFKNGASISIGLNHGYEIANQVFARLKGQ